MNGENSGQSLASGDTGGHSVASIGDPAHMMQVTRCAQPSLGPNIYPMRSNPRGFCLIFNIFDFANNSWDIRRGSEAEAKRLKEVFEDLHFRAEVMDNPTKKEINAKLEECAKCPELKQHDSIVVIVLSHGKSGAFVASDGFNIQFKDFVDLLNNKNCPNLINKPKLFFFSCCRGETKDFGVDHTIQALDDMHVNAVSDAAFATEPRPDGPITYRVPNASDIMICYSTVDQYVSWRCEQNGSWLGLALSSVLMKHSYDTDLLELLTLVSNQINDKKSRDFSAKQVVEIILRGFKKKFYFNPGYIDSTTESADEPQQD